MKKFFNRHKAEIIGLIIIIIFTIINIIAIYLPDFSENYRKYIFSHVSDIWSRITGIVPFSIGEIMIYTGIIVVIGLVVLIILGLFPLKKVKKIRNVYIKVFVYILVFAYGTETLNCFVLYHANSIEETIYCNINIDDSDEKLLEIYNHVTDKLNELGEKLNRDKNGDIIQNYTYKECKEALLNVNDSFPLLKGYFPNPKKLYSSGIMTQQYLCGVYFPFSMEANYNYYMYPSNFPATICHELSHLKGYIMEDEANFIAFVACINSDNEFIQYSGYLSVYCYLYEELYNLDNVYIYEQMKGISQNVYRDLTFVDEDKFKEIEDKSLVDTDSAKKASDKFIDSNLKNNGVSSGIDNYNEVVRLLIYYYN